MQALFIRVALLAHPRSNSTEKLVDRRQQRIKRLPCEIWCFRRRQICLLEFSSFARSSDSSNKNGLYNQFCTLTSQARRPFRNASVVRDERAISEPMGQGDVDITRIKGDRMLFGDRLNFEVEVVE